MVKIRKITINGLYSYRISGDISFGERNIIVGPNDSGKSSIFKSIKFLLEYLTEYNRDAEKPWNSLDEYATIALELSLDDDERRFLLDLFCAKPIDNTNTVFFLDNFKQESILLEKIKTVKLLVVWKINDFYDARHNFTSYIDIPELGLRIYSQGFNSGAVAKIEQRFFTQMTNLRSLFDVINSLDLKTKSLNELKDLFPENSESSVQIHNIPAPIQFTDSNSSDRVLSAPTKIRLERIFKLSGANPQQGQNYSIFYLFYKMLQKRIKFVSEQRQFTSYANLEKSDLKDDGSNLQSYLFWLQNSNNQKDKQTFSNIKKCFEEVMSSQRLSFDVSLTEKEVKKKETWDWGPTITEPDKCTILFLEKVNDSVNKFGFTSVGAGVRECLFLITKCLDSKHSVITLDEPALNLHPLQINLLMKKIFLINNESSDNNNQIIIITHSPTLATLDTLTEVNEIVRIKKKLGTSVVIQPNTDDKKWLADQLPTFHLLKPDVLFSKVAILVEGPSDKIFLETLLKNEENNPEIPVDAICVLDVGGKLSFPKFQQFMKIFSIPYIILADNDVQGRFTPSEVNLIEDNLSMDENKKIYVLKVKDLEAYLEKLDQNLFNKITKEYERKQEVAYHFINELLKKQLPKQIEPIMTLMKHAGKLI